MVPTQRHPSLSEKLGALLLPPAACPPLALGDARRAPALRTSASPKGRGRGPRKRKLSRALRDGPGRNVRFDLPPGGPDSMHDPLVAPPARPPPTPPQPLAPAVTKPAVTKLVKVAPAKPPSVRDRSNTPLAKRGGAPAPPARCLRASSGTRTPSPTSGAGPRRVVERQDGKREKAKAKERARARARAKRLRSSPSPRLRLWEHRASGSRHSNWLGPGFS